MTYSPGLNNPTAGPIVVTGPLTNAELRASPVVASISPVVDTPVFFEDTSFVTGDSPATLDLNTALGRNATQVSISNYGSGTFSVATSTDGASFGDAINVYARQNITFSNISIDSVRITWVSDSWYWVTAI